MEETHLEGQNLRKRQPEEEEAEKVVERMVGPSGNTCRR